MLDNTRTDGLSVSQAIRTIRYIAGKTGIELEVTPGLGHLRGQAPPAACDPVAELLHRVHGFGVTVSDRGDAAVIAIDPATCPTDATAEERIDLAERLAARAGAAAAAAWSAAAPGERGYGRDAGEASEHAADQEYRWCLQQTVGFLRQRAAAVSPGAALR